MSLRHRLEVLEGHLQPKPEDRSEVRAWMKAHLDRLAAYRRGDMPEDERPEFEVVHAAVMRGLEEYRERRGEGGR